MVRRWFIGLLIGSGMAAAGAPGLSAQEFEEHVTKTGVYKEDLFVTAETVNIVAEVAGEVIAMGLEVTIDSRVSGDVIILGGDLSVGDAILGRVLAAGGRITANGRMRRGITALGGTVDLFTEQAGHVLAIAGKISNHGLIDGNLRMLGGLVENYGVVDGNLLAVGGRVELDDESNVGGRALLAGGTIVVGGYIGRDLKAVGRIIEIAGEIDGDIDVHGMEIYILPSASIAGDLIYHSPREAEIDPRARIGGDVTFIRSQSPEHTLGNVFAAAGAIGTILAIGLIIVGAVFILVFPALSLSAAQEVVTARWKVFGIGLVVVVAGPIAMLMTAVTVVGIPLTVFIFSLYVVITMSGMVVAAIAVGRGVLGVFGRSGDGTYLRRVGVLALGVLLLSLIVIIPILGFIIAGIAKIMGTGALALRVCRRHSPIFA